MGGFVITDGRFGDLDTLRVVAGDGRELAVIARRGATLLRWHPAAGADPDGLIDGYADAAEFAAQAGVRSGLMAPFSNRIRDGRYTFDGEQHQLRPVLTGQEDLVFHGFLRVLDCEVVDTELTAPRPPGSGWAPSDPARGLPRVPVRDRSRGRLHVHRERSDPGGRRAQRRRPGRPLRLRLAPVLPARRRAGRPAGAARAGPDLDRHRRGADPARRRRRRSFRSPSEDRPAYAQPRPIADAVLDVAFTDLIADDDGLVRTRLRDPDSGRSLTVWQHGGLMHVFTGDTLDRGPRSSIALEPVELMTNAFARPDCADALALAPGAERRFRCGVDASS